MELNNALIQIYGQASNVHLTLNLGTRYTTRHTTSYGEVAYVNLANVNNDGFDMAVKIDNHHIENFTLVYGASNDISVDVRLSHIWQRHGLKSNVQINTCCKRGLIGSMWYVMCKGVTVFENGKFCLRVNH